MDEESEIINNPQKQRKTIQNIFYILAIFSFFSVSIISIIFPILMLSKIMSLTSYQFQIFSYVVTYILQGLTCLGYLFLGLIVIEQRRKLKQENLQTIEIFYGFPFFLLATLVIANEIFFSWVEVSCIGDGCLLLLPSMISVPILGLISALAFFGNAGIFPKITEDSRKINKYSKAGFILIAALEVIRYFTNGILSPQVNVKFSCNICKYTPLADGPREIVIALTELTTFNGYFLFIVNYVITPIYFIILGIILLVNYRDKKKR